MIVVIDGDSLVYKAAGAAQKKDKIAKQVHAEPVEFACSNAKKSIMTILEKTQATDYRLFLTHSKDNTSFRILKNPDYKANRRGMERPVHYEAVREYFINVWKANVVSKIEADDAVSITYTEYFNKKIEACISGIDKDLLNTPGLHYNPDKDLWRTVTEFDALKNFWIQILEGDKADHIPRINKGWGKKKREKEVKRKVYEATDIDKLINLIYTEYSLFYSDPKHEIQKRGELLWIMRKPEDYWEFNYD